MEQQSKKARLLGFVSFLLTIGLVVDLVNGDFLQITNWSSAENMGGALFKVILLVGTFFFIKEVLFPAFHKRKEASIGK